jgi:hypothetical protein
MKKILVALLLTFTTIASADEERYSMVNNQTDRGGVWILDAERGQVKHCWLQIAKTGDYVSCSDWEEI